MEVVERAGDGCRVGGLNGLIRPSLESSDAHCVSPNCSSSSSENGELGETLDRKSAQDSGRLNLNL